MIKKLLALILALSIPVQALAAITRGTITTGQSTDDFNFAHVVDAGSNLALAVMCAMEADSKSVTVTYNSVDVPLISGAELGHSVSQAKIQWFILANPATGSNSVAMDISAADDIACAAINLTGVNQSSPTIGTPQTAEFSAGTASAVSQACASGNWYLDALMAISAANFTADGENAEISEFDATAFTVSLSEDATPDGTVNGSWAFTSESGVQVSICIRAAVDLIPGSTIWFK